MLVKDANEITGGLSSPSKMPGRAYNLPARECKVGSALRRVKKSVCSGCYALKNRYMFPKVQQALYKRFKSIEDDRWVPAMAFLINKQCSKVPYFRWHDSGDIQSVAHLQKIVDVCTLTPTVNHWLPTREYKLVKQFLDGGGVLPENLNVRLSAQMIDMGLPVAVPGCSASVVLIDMQLFPEAHKCPAAHQDNSCGDCRDCWDDSVALVAYPYH